MIGTRVPAPFRRDDRGSHRPVVLRYALLVLLVALVAACGNDDGTGATTTATGLATTTTQATATTRAATTTVPTGSETIFGWVRGFEGTADATSIDVDPSEMLTGDEAVAAARQDGVIGPDEALPNDYYIRNPDETTTRLTVSPDVVVVLQACYPGGPCVTTEQVDLATWSVLLGGEDDPGLAWDWYGTGSLPYDFTVENGEVVEIDEVYLP